MMPGQEGGHKTAEGKEGTYNGLDFAAQKQIEAVENTTKVANAYFASEVKRQSAGGSECIFIYLPYHFAETGIFQKTHINDWKKITKDQFPDYYIDYYRQRCDCEPTSCAAYEGTCAVVSLKKGKEPPCVIM